MTEQKSCQVAIFILLLITIGGVSLSKGECPKDPEWVDMDVKCAKIFAAEKGWDDANGACKEKSGKLLSVHSSEQQERLLSLISNGKYWIGGHIPALVFQSNFDRCQSGNDFRGESCFEILADKLSWSEAQGTCRDLGGNLASITDEEMNIFVGESMLKMAKDLSKSTKSAGESANSNDASDDDSSEDGSKSGESSDTDGEEYFETESLESFSYWIDGHGDGATLDFVDSNGGLLVYTNFMPSTVQNGPSCLQVYPKVPEEKLPNDLEDQVKDATATALENAMENMTAMGIPEAVPQSTVASYSSSNYTTYDSNPDAPQYDIVDCGERRMAVCQFALKVVEAVNSSQDSDKRGSNPTRPSHTSSCKKLAMLALFAERSSRLNLPGLSENNNSFLMRHRDVQNGYYIFDDGTKKLPNDSGKINKFELEYCDIASAKKNIDDGPEYFMQLFKWLSSAKGDGLSDNTITSLGLVQEQNLYDGACILAETDDERWHPDLCSEQRPYVCEFSKKSAKKYFCDDKQDKEWCDSEDSLRKLTGKTHSLLATLKEQPNVVDPDSMTASVNLLRDFVVQAKLSNVGTTVPRTTRGSVENFTTNVLETASVLFHQDVEDITGIQSKERSLIGTVNLLSEYVADTMMLLEEQDDALNKNATMLLLTSQGIRLRIYILANETEEERLDNYATFTLSEREVIRMDLSAEQRRMSEAHGVAFINVQYHDLGTATFAPQSFNSVADDASLSVLNASTGTYNYETPDYRRGKNTFSMLATNILTATCRINGTNYPTSVQFSMKKQNLTADLDVVPNSESCVFLSDEETNAGLHWSGRGCYRVSENEGSDYHCECNHTTDFAVMLLVFEPETDILEGHRDVIFVLTIVAQSLSIVCLLAATLLFVFLKRELKSDRRVIHVNLFVALLLANLTMVISQLMNRARTLSALEDTQKSGNGEVCIALTFLCHISTLTAMFWMLVEGIVIYRKIVVVISRQIKTFHKGYYVIGWGFPLVISGVSLAIGMLTDIKYNTDGCWLAIRSGMIWSFGAPMLVITLVNTIITVMVLRVALRTQIRKMARRADAKDSEKSKITYLKTASRGLLVLTPLLGLTWVFGLLMFHVAMAYIFVILTASQGISIFFCYCVFNPEVRSALDMKLRHYRARRFSPMNEDKLCHLHDQPRSEKKLSLKTRLFMRLSISTASAPSGDKSNSAHSGNSPEMEEKQNEYELIEEVPHEAPPATSLPPSPSSHRFTVGIRNSSASTRSTYLSNHSFSSSSLRDSLPIVSYFHVKKMTSKVRPMSVDQNSTDSIFQEKRPSTADAMNPSQTKTHKNSKKSGVPLTEPMKRRERRRAPKPSRRSKLDSDKDTVPVDNADSTSSLDGTMENEHCSPFGRECCYANPILQMSSESEEETKYASKTILNVDTTIVQGSPTHHRRRNEISPEANTNDHEHTHTNRKGRRDQYYNVLVDAAPIQLYSNAWTRRAKPAKRHQSPGKRQTEGKSKVTITRGDISITRCHNCNSVQKRPTISTGQVGSNRKSNIQSLGTKLEVVDLTMPSEQDFPQSRPSSRDSGDSGILPDEVGCG